MVETPDRPEYTSWTKVQHKHARSDSFVNKNKNLSSGPKRLVNLAKDNLTKEQQQKLQKRQEKIRPRQASSTSSRGEGLSKAKGKTIDPREWGNVNLSHDSLDVDAQAAAWNSLKNQHRTVKNARKSHRKKGDDIQP